VIFSVYYVAALVLAGGDLRGRLAQWRFQTLGPSALWCAVLPITYAAQIAILVLAAQRHPWPVALVPPVLDRPALVTGPMLALAALQVYALAALYRARIGGAAIAAGVVMTLLSCIAPVFANADVYAYAGNGVLGLAAYAPPHAPFPGDLAAINARWGTPVPAATYGPLWLLLARATGAVAPALAGKLLAFRALALAFFGLTLLALRGCGLPTRVLAIAAANPGLQLQFVLDAHNDVVAIALVVGAAALVRKLPAVACALLVAAALVKLPYALLGLPVLAAIASPARRYAACAAVVAGSAALSWIFGGEAYARALIGYASSTGLLGVVHAVAALGAVAAIVAAVAGARRFRAAVWLMPMLGAYTASWYAIWGLPYALGRRRVVAYLLLWFPLVSVLAEPSLATPWTMLVVIPVLVALSLRYSLQPRPS